MKRLLAASSLLLIAGLASPTATAEVALGEIPLKFDRTEAAAMLEPGSSIIKGRGFMRTKLIGGKKYAEQEAVFLYPMTLYMQEWYRRFHDSPGIGFDAMLGYADERALRFAGKTVTDTKGNFEFRNVKPGKYIVYLGINYIVSASWRDQIGTETVTHAVVNGGGQVIGTTGQSSTPIYGDTVHVGAARVPNHIIRLVEVKKDGVTIDLGEIRR
jgi:hypothetical protein